MGYLIYALLGIGGILFLAGELYRAARRQREEAAQGQRDLALRLAEQDELLAGLRERLDGLEQEVYQARSAGLPPGGRLES